jgi:hypothetical protein
MQHKNNRGMRDKIIDILHGKICPYCLIESTLVDSQAIYGEGHEYGNMYLCQKCGAYVGCHEGTDKALGRLANRELREWKSKVHEAFDPIWRTGKINEIWPKYIPNTSNRNKAYKWLASQLEIKEEFCHIGMFSIRYCQKAIKVIENETENSS